MFEKFHFDQAVLKTSTSGGDPSSVSHQTRVNVVDPCVHILDGEGRAACVAYVSSTQVIDPVTGRPVTRNTANTRLWLRSDDGDWINVHHHRG